MDNQTQQHGFTLVEFIISFALVTFLIVGTAQLVLYSLLIKRRADCNFLSAELTSSKLEYFKSLPYESEKLKECFQDESISKEGLPGIFRREWRIQDLSPNMKRVEIESYSKNLPQKKTRLVLFLSRELGF